MLMRDFLVTTLLAAGVTAPAYAFDRGVQPIASWSQEAAFADVATIKVGEHLARPPRTTTERKVMSEQTPESTGNAIVTNLKSKFDAAADPNTHLLTKAAASNSGWGWAADHFDAIDEQKKGAVSFDDILRYLNRNAVVPLKGA